MDINEIISVSISVASPGVTKPGFGEPMVYSNSTVIPASEMVRRYSTATWSADMITDGFVASDPAYLAVQAIASQEPKPQSVKVARGTQDFDHDMDLTVLTAVEAETITVTIYGENPAAAGTITSETYTRTVPPASNLAAEATAVAALITAGIWGVAGDITAVGNAAVVEIRAAVGFGAGMLYYDLITNLSVEDVTTTRTVATDLNAIVAQDPDWYVLVPADAFGAADLAEIAAWTAGQTNKKAVCATQDTAILTAGGGIGATLSAANYTDTRLIHSKRRLSLMPHGADSGRFLPETAGTIIWAFEELTGVLPSSYTTAESGYAHDNYVNTYGGVTIGGVTSVTGMIYGGWSSGSSETMMDTVRLIDALVVEVQVGLLALFMATKKVPFNESGVGEVKSSILEAVRVYEGPKAGLLPGSAFCEVPMVSTISDADKQAGELNNVTFGATLNGAIKKVTIAATLQY